MQTFIESNGITLHYHDEGAGEPLILLHGLTANAANFGGLIDAGLAERFRVIRVDLRGRGLSDKPDHGYSMAEHAADIIGLMDALELDQVAMGGHSFGGLLTFYLSATYPDRIKKLIVMDAAAEATRLEVVELIRPSLQRLERTMPSEDDYVNAMKNLAYYHDGFWDAQLEAFYRADVETLDDGSVRPHARAELIEQAIDGVLAEDWFGHFARITQPVLLLQAPDGLGPAGTPPVLSNKGAQETADALQNCTYKAMFGNHITMVFGKYAPAIVQEITSFIDDEGNNS